ncbi:MAG: RsmB/NOP family class I SAM-dependent RNA methyltransferase [Opitutaceae bacterium]
MRLIDAVEPHLKPGEDVAACVQDQIRRIRGAGSRDRRLYRELVFTWFRYREWIDPLRAVSPLFAGQFLILLADPTTETASGKAALPEVLASLKPGDPVAASAILSSYDPHRPYHAEMLEPGWVATEFPASATSHLPHTLKRPPIWLRTDPDAVATIVAELRHHGLQAEPSGEVPGAIAVPTGSKVDSLEALKDGRIEIQDIGSQAILHQATPAKGEKWLDACAGAGGKSLHLAGLVGAEGSVTAMDRRASALAELQKRAERSGLANIRCLSQRLSHAPRQAFDGVLVDAPCSGSGTWRRHPFLRHQTDPETLAKQAERQIEILGQAANCVRPGGRLVYATCSLCRTENEAVVEAFLARHPDFSPFPSSNPLNLPEAAGPGHYILPERFNGDGFYVAILQRKPPT